MNGSWKSLEDEIQKDLIENNAEYSIDSQFEDQISKNQILNTNVSHDLIDIQEIIKDK
jgi:hypothetical protein